MAAPRQGVVKRYLPTGETRSVWNDAVASREREHGVLPQRASRIEVITEGPKRGLFHVDFSLLADVTGDERFRICLREAFVDYSAANAAEVAWLHDNWVLDGTDAIQKRT